jgi:rhodanese-related sulfurtransferase
MTISELKNSIKTDPSLLILDVRMPEELIGPLGKIEKVVNIPLQQLEKRIGELDIYKDRTIAVICRSGVRSSSAQRFLAGMGFNAYNVEGGMVQFRIDEKQA